MRQAWKKLRYRLEYIGLLVAAKLVPIFPRSAIGVLAKFCGAVASVVDVRGQRVALANLECAFPGKYSTAERRRIVRESYQHFAQTMVDVVNTEIAEWKTGIGINIHEKVRALTLRTASAVLFSRDPAEAYPIGRMLEDWVERCFSMGVWTYPLPVPGTPYHGTSLAWSLFTAPTSRLSRTWRITPGNCAFSSIQSRSCSPVPDRSQTG